MNRCCIVFALILIFVLHPSIDGATIFGSRIYAEAPVSVRIVKYNSSQNLNKFYYPFSVSAVPRLYKYSFPELGRQFPIEIPLSDIACYESIYVFDVEIPRYVIVKRGREVVAWQRDVCVFNELVVNSGRYLRKFSCRNNEFFYEDFDCSSLGKQCYWTRKGAMCS
jgi:hypothetical protein